MTKEENISYYMINKGLQFTNLNADERYVLDFNRLLYLLLIVESEYMKLTAEPLFPEDFFENTQGISFGTTDKTVCDMYYTDYLKQKLSIFENVENNKYGCKAFEFIPDELICEIIDNIMLVFGTMSLGELKQFVQMKLELKYDYPKLITKEKLMSASFLDGTLDIQNKPRKRTM